MTPGYDPYPYPSIDTARQFALAPVVAGMWKQHEIWDGTYDFDDLLDAHEMLAVRAINRQRAQAAAERGVN